MDGVYIVKRTSKKFLMAATMLAVVSGNRVFATTPCTGSPNLTMNAACVITGSESGSITSDDGTGVVSFDTGNGNIFTGSIGTSSNSVASISTTNQAPSSWTETLVGGSIYTTALNIIEPVTLNVGSSTDSFITSIGTVAYTSGAGAVLNLNSGTVTVSGNITSSQSASISAGIGSLTFGGNTTVSVAGNIGDSTHYFNTIAIGSSSAGTGTAPTAKVVGNLYTQNLYINGVVSTNGTTGAVTVGASGDSTTTSISVVTYNADGSLNVNATTSTFGQVVATGGVGTLTFAGSGGGTVTGLIGNASNYLSTLNAGVASSTVTLQGTSFLNALNFTGAGTVALQGTTTANTIAFGSTAGVLTIANGLTVTGNVTSAGVPLSGKGTVQFLGTGTLTGNIGDGNNTHLSKLDTSAGIVSISGKIGVDTLALGQYQLSLTGVNSTSLVNSHITLNAASKSAYGNVSSAGSISADNTSSVTVTLPIGTTIAAGNSLTVLSSQTSGGGIGVMSSILTTDTNGSNIAFRQDTTNTKNLVLVAANTCVGPTTYLSSCANCIIAANISDNITTTDASGIVYFANAGTTSLTLTGYIGNSTNAMAEVDTSPGVGNGIVTKNFYTSILNINGSGTLSLTGSSSVTNIGTLNYKGDGTLSINSAAVSITGDVIPSTSASSAGTLIFGANSGSVTVSGDIGLSTTLLKLLDIETTATVSLSGNVYSAALDIEAQGTVNAGGMGKTNSLGTVTYTANGALNLKSDTKNTITSVLEYKTTTGITTIADSNNNVIGSVAATGAGSGGAGTLVFVGDGAITNDVGTLSANVGTITAQGVANKAVALDGKVYLAALNINGAGAVTVGLPSSTTASNITNVLYGAAGSLNLNSSAVTVGSIDYQNHAGTTTLASSSTSTIGTILSTGSGTTAGAGTFIFSGSGSVTGVVGTSSNYLALITTNTGTVTLGESVYAAALDINGAGTVNLGETGETAVIGSVLYKAAGSLNLVSDTAIITSLDYKGYAGSATIAGSTSNVIGAVLSTGASSAGAGTLNFSGSATVTGAVGATNGSTDDGVNFTNYLALITTNTGTVTLGEAVYAAALDINGAGAINLGEVGETAIIGSVLYKAAGALNLVSDTATITSLDYKGYAGTTTIADSSKNTVGSILSTGGGLTGGGTVSFLGSGSVSGVVGTSGNYLSAIKAGAAGKTVVLGSDVYATTLTVNGTGTVTASTGTSLLTTIAYTANGALNLNAGSVIIGNSLTGGITSNGSGVGSLTFGGTGTVSVQGGIAANSGSLALITVGTSPNAAPTTTILGDVYAVALDINGTVAGNGTTGAVTIGQSLDGETTSIGTVSYNAAGLLNLDSDTIAIGSGGIITSATGVGALNFGGSGSATVSGTVGQSSYLLGTLSNNTGTVTLNSNLYVSALNLTGIGTINAGGSSTTNAIGTVTYTAAGFLNLNAQTNSITALNYGTYKGTTTIATTASTIGNVTSTHATQTGAGILTFSAGGSVSGTIGTASDYLGQLITGSGTLTLSKDVYSAALTVAGTGTATAGGASTINNISAITFSSTGSLILNSDTQNTVSTIEYANHAGTVTMADSANSTIGSVASTNATNSGVGTLIFSGVGAVTNGIGNGTDYLSSLVANGVANKVLNIQGSVYSGLVTVGGAGSTLIGTTADKQTTIIGTVSYASTGTLTLDSDTVTVGAITNSTQAGNSTNGHGVLAFGGSGSITVSNDIADGTHYLGIINTQASSTSTVNLNGKLYTTALNLGGTGIMNIGAGSSTNVINAITYSAAGVLNLKSTNATITSVDYQNNVGTMTIVGSSTSTIGSVASTGATNKGAGILTFSGAGSVGAAGTSSDYLGTINAGGAGTTVTLSNNVYTAALTVTGTGIVNAGGTGTINSIGTVSYSDAGTLNLLSDTQNAIATLNYGTNNGTTTISNYTTNQIATVTATGAGNTTGAGIITFLGGGSISNTIGTATDYLGTINAGIANSTVILEGASFMNALNFGGTGTVSVQGATTASTLSFGSYNGTLQIANGNTLAGNITTSGTPGSGIGNVVFLGNGNLSGNAGDNTEHLDSLDVSKGSVAIAGNVGSDLITLGTSSFVLSGTSSILGLNSSEVSLTAVSESDYGNIYNVGSGGEVITDNKTTVSIDVTGYIPNGARLVVAAGQTPNTVAAIGAVSLQGSTNLVFQQDLSDTENLTLVASRPNIAGTNVNSVFNLKNVPAGGDLASILYAIDQESSADAVIAAAQLLPQVAIQSSVQATHAAHQAARRPVYNRTIMLGSGQKDGSGMNAGDDIYPYELSFLDGSEMWFKGFGTTEEQQDREGISGYKNNIIGGTVGVDGHYNKKIQLGVSGAYASSHVTVNDSVSTTDINSYQFTFYGLRRFNKPFYMSGNVSLGWNQYQGSRSIIFPGIDRIAESNYGGHEYSAELGGGAPIKIYGWGIVPHTSVRYHHIEISPYSETNAGDLSLNVHRQHYEVALGEVGLKLNKAFALWSGMLLVPEIHLERQYDFLAQAEDSRASFIGGGDYFETQGLTPYRNSTSKGFGLELTLPNHWVWAADYHMLTNPSYTARSFIVTGRLQF